VADGDVELQDLIADPAAVAPDEAAVSALLAREVDQLLDRLDARERAVIQLRFGLDRGEARTLAEVGAHFNLARHAIQVIEKRAMAKLRHPSLNVHLGAHIAG
jgi:RNA polymerase sigma factor (sigma-70 family)